jgi:hypothetical protein
MKASTADHRQGVVLGRAGEAAGKCGGPQGQAVPLAVLPVGSHLRRSGQSHEPEPCQQAWRALPLLRLASRAAEQENTSRQHHARVRPGCGELIIAASGIGSGVPG